MLSRLNAWADDHRDHALDLVRIYLGLGLFFRGIVFMSDSGAFLEAAGPSGGAFTSLALAHYVGLAHLGGGLLLGIGLMTRAAALLQIPVLIGATFVVHFPSTLLAANQSFAFSALVLALLCVFAVWGGGRWSLDRAVARWVARSDESEAEIAESSLLESRARERSRRGALATERPAAPRLPSRPEEVCIHGYDRDHPSVSAERSYGALSRLRFVFGTHPRPVEVVFRCEECGGVADVLTDPEEVERYRFNRPTEA